MTTVRLVGALAFYSKRNEAERAFGKRLGRPISIGVCPLDNQI